MLSGQTGEANTMVGMDDFPIGRCTRHCAVTERELTPGEVYYAALVEDGDGWKRLDFSAEAWKGPPEGCVGWWKSRVPEQNAKRRRWAPTDIMLRLLDALADRPDRADMRYVLALFLIRRRLLREEERAGEGDSQILTVYSPRLDRTWDIPVVYPAEERVRQIQDELTKLLQGEGVDEFISDDETDDDSTEESDQDATTDESTE
ncbi:hypothetical protein JCM19992_32240 [Thermostilla marina]